MNIVRITPKTDDEMMTRRWVKSSQDNWSGDILKRSFPAFLKSEEPAGLKYINTIFEKCLCISLCYVDSISFSVVNLHSSDCIKTAETLAFPLK